MSGNVKELTSWWVVLTAMGIQAALVMLLRHIAVVAQIARENRITISGEWTAFPSLAFRPLPLGTLNQWSVRVFYADEQSQPAAGLGHRLAEYLQNIVYVVSSKQLSDLELYRCTPIDAERPLLLLDRRVGFGRHVWCLIDVSRPGQGKDLIVKVHRLIPRHLDFLDWTLLRYIAFPFVALTAAIYVISVFSNQRPEEKEAKPGKYGEFLLALVGMFAGILSLIGVLVTKESSAILWGLYILVPGVVISLLLYTFESKEPLKDMERHSTDLMIFVQEALQQATVTMEKPI